VWGGCVYDADAVIEQLKRGAAGNAAVRNPLEEATKG